MPDEEDQNATDLTVYDLAERMAIGLQLSTAAQREVASELLRLKRLIEELLVGVHAFDKVG